METRAPTPRRIAVMVAFALSCFGLLLYLWLAFGGPVPLKPNGYRFSASFQEATQLADQADVRISGVSVGKVVGIEASQGRTRVEMRLEPEFAPLPADSRAILRLKTLLGETYVELTPGSPDGPKVPEGGSLPATSVEPTVELDEVLRSFDPETRTALRVWTTSWAQSLDGRGQDLSNAVGTLPFTLENGSRLLSVLDSQQDSVTRLVRDSGEVFGAIGARAEATRTLITAGEQVFATTAARDRELAATIEILPTFLRELRPTLEEAERTAADAAPVVRALRPAARRVRPALASLSALAPDLRALFVDLDPLIAASRTGLPAATRTVRAAIPLVEVLHPVGRDLVPAVEYLGLTKTELVTQFMNIAATTQATLANPATGKVLHYLRTVIPVTTEAFVSQPQRLPSNRHNPYLAPRGLDKLARGVEAFDCRNTQNAATFPVLGTGAPPCLVQAPLTFRGRTGSFPRLARDAP